MTFSHNVHVYQRLRLSIVPIPYTHQLTFLFTLYPINRNLNRDSNLIFFA